MASLLLVLVSMAVPLIAGIIIIIVASRGRGLGYPACGACKYDLTATIGTATRCPECGAEFAAAGILPPRGARKPVLLWTGVVLLVAPLSCVGFMAARQSLARAQQATAAARQAAVANQIAAAAQQQQGATTAPSNAATTAPQQP